MFECKLEKAGLLKNIVDSVKDLIAEAEFDCTKQGITMQSMDSSHVSLVSLLLRGESFESYRCDRIVNLGISMKNLANVLKCASADDTLRLECEDQPDKLNFTFQNDKANKCTEFELKLMDIDAEHLGIPESKFMARVTMKSTEFKRVCSDLTNFGDTVTITATKEGVRFTTTGEMGAGSISLRQGSSDGSEDKGICSVDIHEPVTLNFALQFLNFFTKATALSDMVVLSLTNEAPLTVEYRMEQAGYLRFYLAPKIDDDEDEEMGQQ